MDSLTQNQLNTEPVSQRPVLGAYKHVCWYIVKGIQILKAFSQTEIEHNEEAWVVDPVCSAMLQVCSGVASLCMSPASLTNELAAS